MAGKPGRSGRPGGRLNASPAPRVQEMLRLRAEGFSFAEIGRRLSVSKQTAQQSIARWEPRSARSDDAPHTIRSQRMIDAHGLPDLAHSSAHIYFAGAPRFTYCYAPSSNLHTIRIDARRFGAAIAITDDIEAWNLVCDLEFVARELRRRIDLPAAPAPSQA